MIMPQEHDPIEQIKTLRQILSANRRPLGLFLGAGCPVSIKVDGVLPLIPDVAGLTDFVLNQANAETQQKLIFDKVKLALTADRVIEPTIEDYLTRIRTLESVVGEGNDHVRGLTKNELKLAEAFICTQITKKVSCNLPSNETGYSHIARWIGAISRADSVEIFTPNYDVLIEEAFERNRIPYFDGFVGSREPFFDLYAIEEDKIPARWARLWKLHGSINWIQTENGEVCRTIKPPDGTAMVHPSHLKYDQTRKMPYLAMLDRLSAFLRRPGAVLIISGYSFRDDHLNDAIVRSLEGNAQALGVGIVFGDLQSNQLAVKKAASRANLSILAADGAVIGTKVGGWRSAKDEEELELAYQNSLSLSGNAYDLKLVDFDALGKFFQEIVSSAPGVAFGGPNV